MPYLPPLPFVLRDAGMNSHQTPHILAKERLSRHILPTSATMAGVCLTGIGLVKLIETKQHPSSVDEILAFDCGLFCASMLFAFCAVYWEGKKGALQDAMAAIWLFVGGIVLMLVACSVLAFDLDLDGDEHAVALRLEAAIKAFDMVEVSHLEQHAAEQTRRHKG